MKGPVASGKQATGKRKSHIEHSAEEGNKRTKTSANDPENRTRSPHKIPSGNGVSSRDHDAKDGVSKLQHIGGRNPPKDKLQLALMKSKKSAEALQAAFRFASSGKSISKQKMSAGKNGGVPSSSATETTNPSLKKNLEAKTASSYARAQTTLKPDAKKKEGLTDLQAKMRKSLAGGRFRMINEKLYTARSEEAFEMFSKEPELFYVYHDGFRAQVEAWPENPVDHYIRSFTSRKPGKEPLVIADLGCGEAALARSLLALNSSDPSKPRRFIIHSFDLHAPNENVVACDVRNVPLPDKTVDVALFSLALMGTNFLDFIREAWRILRTGGELKIAEVVSRIPSIENFIAAINSVGFQFVSKSDQNIMFVSFEFTKIARRSEVARDGGEPILTPCIYKKRIIMSDTCARRVGRVGCNEKNNSSDIFKFGGSLGYAEEADRYRTHTYASEQEKKKRQQERIVKEARYEVKRPVPAFTLAINVIYRQWLADIEKARWKRMADDYARQEELWQKRHNASKIGKNSVSYNPITLEYHKSVAGERLAQEDSKTLHRTAMRSAHLYLKNNTFDPMRCQDIPRKLEADVLEESVAKRVLADDKGNSVKDRTNLLGREHHDKNLPGQPALELGKDSGLNIPRQLITVAAQTAKMVNDRVGTTGGKVVFSGTGPSMISGKPVLPPVSAEVSSLGNMTSELRKISVEVDGNGKHHNWARHF